METADIRISLSPRMRWVRAVMHAFVYHLRVKPAITRVDRFSMFGFALTVPPSVFHPRFYRTTRFFAGYLSTIPFEGKRVLEIGSGSGLLSLVAARNGASVTSLDINPHAVECTRHNAETNRLAQRVSTLQSDLFAQLPGDARFDFILWSPPFYPRDPTGAESHAWNAGIGYSVLSRFAQSAGGFLHRDGVILLLLSTEVDTPVILSFFREAGLQISIAAQRRLPFEILTIYRIESTPHIE